MTYIVIRIDSEGGRAPMLGEYESKDRADKAGEFLKNNDHSSASYESEEL